jgi:hypothetical protein
VQCGPVLISTERLVRQLTFEFNIEKCSGKKIHDLRTVPSVPTKGDTEPKLVTVPFRELVQKAKHAVSTDVSPAAFAMNYRPCPATVGLRPPSAGDRVSAVNQQRSTHA